MLVVAKKRKKKKKRIARRNEISTLIHRALESNQKHPTLPNYLRSKEKVLQDMHG